MLRERLLPKRGVRYYFVFFKTCTVIEVDLILFEASFFCHWAIVLQLIRVDQSKRQDCWIRGTRTAVKLVLRPPPHVTVHRFWGPTDLNWIQSSHFSAWPRAHDVPCILSFTFLFCKRGYDTYLASGMGFNEMELHMTMWGRHLKA